MTTINPDRIVETLESALRHPEMRNHHLRRLLRWCTDPSTAETAARMLAGWSSALIAALEHEGFLDQYTLAGVVQRCEEAGLAVAPQVMSSAFTQAIEEPFRCRCCAHPATDLQVDPAGFVLAAYALGRDLAAVEFDEDSAPNCGCFDGTS